MNLKLKVLILFVCSLIITMVPASAVETSSIMAQNTDNIKANQANLAEDNKEIAESTDTIDYHAKIIQDTVNEMNNVKWYQFWKWDFYLRKGPNKINSEGKIIESISQNINIIGSNAEQNADQISDKGEKGVQIALDILNRKNSTNIGNNTYNTGDANANAQLIASELTSQFKNNYIVTAPKTLEKGDIVQHYLSLNNYVYLQYVGMNPAKDTALFIGDRNTAVRLPVNDMRIKNKIASKTASINTANTDSSNVNINMNTSAMSHMENVVTSPQIMYIDMIQKNGLKDYNNSQVSDYTNQINNEKKKKTSGSNLMIAGAVIATVAAIISGTLMGITGFTSVLTCMAAVIPPVAPLIPFFATLCGILGWIALSLSIISSTLVITGSAIFNKADKKISKLNEDEKTFIDETNAIGYDLNTYNDGETNNLPVSHDSVIDVEKNGNSSGTLNATDADGDGLIYIMDHQASNGTVTINNNGTYTYTPNKNFTGNDSFTYKSNDIYGDSNIATVKVIVHPVNHPPVSNNLTFDTETNNNLTGALKVTDTDGDTVTCNIVNSTSHGNITLNNDGTFNYIPEEGFIGNDTFTYKAQDWKETGNTATVQINVHPVNQAPVSTDINCAMNKNENIIGNLTATDEDKDPLSYNLENKPYHGNLILNSDGSFSYIPDHGFIGNDTFTYIAHDWKEISNTGTVTIEVLDVNHAPVVQNMNLNMTMNKELKGIFKATDLDGDNLKYKENSNPLHGTVKITANQFIYTPAKDFIGTDTFTYKANDGRTDSSYAKVIIYVSKNTVKSNIKSTIPTSTVTNTNSDKNTVNTAKATENTRQNSLNQLPKLNSQTLPDISTKHPTLNQTLLQTPEMTNMLQNPLFQFITTTFQKATNNIASLFK
jgi:VCBS repeat-containing protein